MCRKDQYYDFCFFIYINDLPQGLNSEVKLFADDTSLFNTVNYVNTSASAINSDLLKIQDCGYHGNCHLIQIEQMIKGKFSLTC